MRNRVMNMAAGWAVVRAAFVFSVVVAGGGGCKCKVSSKHETTVTTAGAPDAGGVAVPLVVTVDAAPVEAHAAAQAQRHPTVDVLDAETCAIVSRRRPLDFKIAPTWLAAAGDEAHLMVVVDNGPGAIGAYHGDVEGWPLGDFQSFDVPGGTLKLVAVESAGAHTLVLVESGCQGDGARGPRCVYAVVLDANAALVSSRRSQLPGELVSWASAADGRSGMYLYREHAKARPVLEHLWVTPDGKVQSSEIAGATAGAPDGGIELGGLAADGDDWALVLGRGDEARLVTSRGASVSLGPVGAKVRDGALVELGGGVVGIATTGEAPLVVRHDLDGKVLPGDAIGQPPLDRMWGEPTFTSDLELHFLRLKHPRQSHEQSTAIDALARHGDDAPFAYAHWTGRQFLVFYTGFAEDQWRLFAAGVACDG